MSKTKIVIGVLVLAVLLFLGVTYPRGNTIIERVTEKLGAVSTLEVVDSPYIGISGHRSYQNALPMSATSSVVCSLKNPLGATSTIDKLSLSIDTNRLGIQTVYVSTSTYANGSSTMALFRAITPAANQSYAAALQKNSATTSDNSNGGLGDPTLAYGLVSGGLTNYKLGATEYITYKLASTTAGTFSGGYNLGTCGIELTEM